MEQKNEKDKSWIEDPEKKDGKDSKKEWQKPTFEDVSERIMAQPYIRFT